MARVKSWCSRIEERCIALPVRYSELLCDTVPITVRYTAYLVIALGHGVSVAFVVRQTPVKE